MLTEERRWFADASRFLGLRASWIVKYDGQALQERDAGSSRGQFYGISKGLAG